MLRNVLRASASLAALALLAGFVATRFDGAGSPGPDAKDSEVPALRGRSVTTDCAAARRGLAGDDWSCDPELGLGAGGARGGIGREELEERLDALERQLGGAAGSVPVTEPTGGS